MVLFDTGDWKDVWEFYDAAWFQTRTTAGNYQNQPGPGLGPLIASLAMERSQLLDPAPFFPDPGIQS